MNIQQVPILRGIVRNLNLLYQASKLYIPPGHYYSPIFNKKEVARNADRIFKIEKPAGIDIREAQQLELLRTFQPFYNDFVSDWKNRRFTFYTPDNGFYSHKDGIFLYSMMRHFQPKQVIEVGSGYSSALMEDIAKLYLQNTNLLFIEPYPEERLVKLISSRGRRALIERSKVQDQNPSVFESLGENDILFIDSSHVAKVGSDVNYLLFEVLPRLKKGVLIHFHDIYYPFQYKREHVLDGKFFSWNEAYILRAFLSYNQDFEVVFWNSFIEHEHRDVLEADFPEYFNRWGASIWIRKVK